MNVFEASEDQVRSVTEQYIWLNAAAAKVTVLAVAVQSWNVAPYVAVADTAFVQYACDKSLVFVIHCQFIRLSGL